MRKKRDALTSTLNTNNTISEILGKIVRLCQDEYGEKTVFVNGSAIEAFRTYLYNFYNPEAVMKILDSHEKTMAVEGITLDKTAYLTRLRIDISTALRYIKPKPQCNTNQ